MRNRQLTLQFNSDGLTFTYSGKRTWFYITPMHAIFPKTYKQRRFGRYRIYSIKRA